MKQCRAVTRTSRVKNKIQQNIFFFRLLSVSSSSNNKTITIFLNEMKTEKRLLLFFTKAPTNWFKNIQNYLCARINGRMTCILERTQQFCFIQLADAFIIFSCDSGNWRKRLRCYIFSEHIFRSRQLRDSWRVRLFVFGSNSIVLNSNNMSIKYSWRWNCRREHIRSVECLNSGNIREH